MLYHKDLGFPKSLIFKSEYDISLNYTQHANSAANSDRYGKIKLPNTIKFSKSEIIEVESFDNIFLDKIVVRINYNQEYDLCLVIIPGSNLVKTVWLNFNKDNHKTLDKNKYNKIN